MQTSVAGSEFFGHRQGPDLNSLRVGKPAEAMRTASSTPPARSCSRAYEGDRLPGLDSGLGFIHLCSQVWHESAHRAYALIS